jgi:hypothetical protein
MFASEIGLALLIVIWYVRERADPETNAFSQNHFLFRTQNVLDSVVYVGLLYVCRAYKNHPHRSTLSFPMTGKKFISCSPFCSRLNLLALESILTQRHTIITHHAAITLLLIFALALFLSLRYLTLSLPCPCWCCAVFKFP